MSGGAIAWDYVVVGSGAGGGTLAARLVESGKRVFVIEAGRDGRSEVAPRLPDDYDVPGFHGFACENDALKWDYAVQHYSAPGRQRRDWKYNSDLGGILYPRAATVGGCTAHNAMIFMLPHEADWDAIAALTGDPSWRARSMRKYLRRLERCEYRPLWRRLRRLGIDPTGHGWYGWLRTEMPQVLEALDDGQLRHFIVETARAFLTQMRHPLRAIPRWVLRFADPNSRQGGSGPFEGLCNPPLATANHARTSARDRLLQAQARYPDRLHIEVDALATRVLFAPDGSASGVEYLKGKGLYRRGALAAGERRAAYARGEVILSAGAFNTPQLLMLSGIGPERQLLEHDIKVRVPLAGVGKNLQDRYEVAVTHRMGRQWSLLQEANFERDDPLWREWAERRNGLYSSNGTVLAFVRRSAGEPLPDIFCMGLPVRFEGYYPGFSRNLVDNRDCLTWAVLKAHTRNRAGEVTLRSRDPRVAPQVNFKYFDEGSDSEGRDLKQMVEAIQFVRRLTAPLIRSGLIGEERVPGPKVDSPEALADYVRDTAWGHHASCSCAMGPSQHGGVIDSQFKVHGVERLRVVDASVFPRIPGFFIVSAVYLVAEKAAEVILKAARERAGTHPTTGGSQYAHYSTRPAENAAAETG
jgi:choline dehydrogenase